MLLSHYAPRAGVRLNTTPRPGEAWLAFGASSPWDGPTRNLSPSGDLHEAARNLFSMLHELDASDATTIAVAAIPSQGLGEAINDRLERAAAPRT
jgi:L-threonylcarbamoyladenylate synthase